MTTFVQRLHLVELLDAVLRVKGVGERMCKCAACSVNFVNTNYSVVFDVCHIGASNQMACCDALDVFVCPYAKEGFLSDADVV